MVTWASDHAAFLPRGPDSRPAPRAHHLWCWSSVQRVRPVDPISQRSLEVASPALWAAGQTGPGPGRQGFVGDGPNGRATQVFYV